VNQVMVLQCFIPELTRLQHTCTVTFISNHSSLCES